jgi:hypothetical protein
MAIGYLPQYLLKSKNPLAKAGGILLSPLILLQSLTKPIITGIVVSERQFELQKNVTAGILSSLAKVKSNYEMKLHNNSQVKQSKIDRPQSYVEKTYGNFLKSMFSSHYKSKSVDNNQSQNIYVDNIIKTGDHDRKTITSITSIDSSNKSASHNIEVGKSASIDDSNDVNYDTSSSHSSSDASRYYSSDAIRRFILHDVVRASVRGSVNSFSKFQDDEKARQLSKGKRDNGTNKERYP